MKKITILLSIIIFLGSCSSLVEEEVFSTITPNNFFQNEADVATAVNGVYDGAQDVNIWWRLFYVTEMTGGLMRHQWKPFAESMVYEDDHKDIWELWKRNYGVIGRANAVLSVMEDSNMDQTIKDRYAAEVRFLRAHTYFNLVRLFGQIPLVTSPPTSIEEVVVLDPSDTEAFESEFLKQIDRNEIYDFVIQHPNSY